MMFALFMLWAERHGVRFLVQPLQPCLSLRLFTRMRSAAPGVSVHFLVPTCSPLSPVQSVTLFSIAVMAVETLKTFAD